MNRLTPVFIGGTGRSGTTILKKILHQHPQVVAVNSELRLLVDPDGVVDLVDALSDIWSPHRGDLAIRRFNRLVEDVGGVGTKKRIVDVLFRKKLWPSFVSPRRYCGYRIAKLFGEDFFSQRMKQLVNELTSESSNGRWLGSPQFSTDIAMHESRAWEKREISELVVGCFDELYRNKSGRTEHTSHWVEDTPYNLLRADSLLELFPHARFVHIYRDPRDVLASYVTKFWGGDNYTRTARRLAAIFAHWQTIRPRVPAERLLEISLESVVQSPSSKLSELSDFLGFPFDESMLRIPLDKSNSGRWRDDIPSDAVESIHAILEPCLAEYGFQS